MKRRTLLQGALLTAVAGRVAAAPRRAVPATFVLVHGAWHGAQLATQPAALADALARQAAGA